jgi:hypothetical protein
MNPTETPSLPGMPLLVALHLAFPAAIEEDVVDFCHEHSSLLPGFSMFAAEGFGASGRLLTAVETVMGRSRGRVLFSILAAADVDAVLVALRRAIPSADVAYWTTPVTQFGRLS